MDYWVGKIGKNRARDIYVTETLESQGWLVIRIWEHDIRADLEGCIDRIFCLVSQIRDK